MYEVTAMLHLLT